MVLAAFMAGFGAGAWFWGRLADRSRRPERLLAALLAGVGLLAAIDLALIQRVLPSVVIALPAGELAPFACAAALLLLPTFLMGGLLPTACRAVLGERASIAATVGRLYALETCGSAAGGLAAGFLLLGAIGQRNTVLLAVAIDLALAAWLLLRGSPPAPAAAAPAAEARPSRAGDAALRTSGLVATFACGFALLALQIIWLRVFRVYLTNTSYTFALVSSISILGLFAGSRLFADRSPGAAPERGMARLLVLLGASVLAGLALLVNLPELLLFPFMHLFSLPTARVLLLPAVAALLVVFPPSLISGYAFPLACGMVANRNSRAGGDVGLALMVNTAGSVLGPPLAAFLLVPFLGAAVSILLVAALIAIAALFLARGGAGLRVFRLSLAAAALALFAAVALRPEIRVLPPSFHRFERELLFYRESREGTLSVGRDLDARAPTRHTYVNNSAVIGSSYDAVKIVKMVGHFPFFAGASVEDALVIGFGIGVTTSAIASHPEVRSIDCVELVPGLADAAGFYRDLNLGVVDDRRLRILPGDGRQYLMRCSRKYDLISCDPTHPILGSGNLYTREYFALCREHLRPGGMVSQYLPLHKLRTRDLLGIIATFHSVFPDCAVWLGHYHAMLLGATEPLAIDFAEWSAEVAALGNDPNSYMDPYHLAATLVLDGEAVARLTAGAPLNLDDRSYTEFFDPACLDPGNFPDNLRWLRDERSGGGNLFTNVADPARLSRFVRGNDLLTESLIHKLNGEPYRGMAALRRAVAACPEDGELPLLLRLYY